MTSIKKINIENYELEFQHSLVTAIQEASPDGILVVDENENIVSHNNRLFGVFGINPKEIFDEYGESNDRLPDKPLLSRVLELVKDPDSFLNRVHELYANPHLEDICEIELKDDRTLERHSTALWGKEYNHLGRVWFFRDITERKNTERMLEYLSHRDPLTGVANRRYFFERVSKEFERSQRYKHQLSFVILDIDHFKEINDKWGHAVGDEVLKNLSACALSILRKLDLFARIGGEEFAILLPDTDSKGAFKLSERLRQHIFKQKLTKGSDIISYTASFGISTVVASDKSEEVIIQRADDALYEAKSMGRNCTCNK